jgi:hypothetical protein
MLGAFSNPSQAIQKSFAGQTTTLAKMVVEDTEEAYSYQCRTCSLIQVMHTKSICLL